MEFDAIITAVTSGKADFGMAGMTVTEERKKSVDFTDPYTTAIQSIIVNEGETKVKTADDLSKATVGVQLGTTGDIYVSDLEGAKVERFSKGADAVLALTQKKVDAVVIDNEPAKKFVEQNKGTKILNEPFENEDYAICLKKGSELTEKFNKALKELKDDGTVKKIIDKYIKA
jgi:polar amino acid transport system substrate-binding protein